MAVDLEAVLDHETVATTADGTPIHTHIIDRKNDERPAPAIVLEARVLGIELTALCGYKWIPSRDPIKYPICPKCEEMFNFARDFYGV